MTAFNHLHPKLQEKLYKMGWTELRPIQVDAINKIFDSDYNLIISASTASGKTEAAFLPILSRIVDSQESGISTIYIGPLKALINDQFERLEQLCKLADIPVFKWHGDVSANAKEKFLKTPKGVLLITPESIESLFINRSDHLNRLFGNLSYIVIDEMHSFIGSERGAHLLSLLSRLMQKSNGNVRLIGLSATIGDPELAKQWLLPRNPESIDLIADANERKSIKYSIRAYSHTQEPDPKDVEEVVESPLILDLITYFSEMNKKNSLIFGNSRVMLEYCTDAIHKYQERLGKTDIFRIHHGSLSKSERESTEKTLKTSHHTATFCSSTLEMGIDIGNVSCIGQIGAPYSVNSLAQRLGRSGRKDGEPSILIMFIPEEDSSNDLVGNLHPELLRAIAMSELLFEKWCEPPQMDLYHYSTFIQQIMSVIKEQGGATLDVLFDTLVTQGSFHNISDDAFLEILRELKKFDLIEQDSTGLVILGLRGEKIAKSFEFYSAFTSPIELDVINDGKSIGSIELYGDLHSRKYLILAGRRWEITSIDLDKAKIYVIPSRGGKLPIYSPTPGPEVHEKVRKKMFELVTSDYLPEYLDEQAKSHLADAQRLAHGLDLLNNPFVIQGVHTYWFTWTSSAKHRTLYDLGKYYGELKVENLEIALKFKDVSPEEILTIYQRLLKNCPTPEDIAKKDPGSTNEKYDRFVPETLLNMAYARKFLDTDIPIRMFDTH